MISKDKQYRTRDGREVRIYATDGFSHEPIQGAIKHTDGWELVSWCSNGRYFEDEAEHPFDLIEIRPRIKQEFWLNIYRQARANVILHPTKKLADSLHQPDRIACVKVVIDCEEGEGL